MKIHRISSRRQRVPTQNTSIGNSNIKQAVAARRVSHSSCGGSGEMVPMRYAAEQAHLLVQGSYKLGRASSP